MQEFLGIYMLNLKVGMIKQIRGTNITAPENSIHAKAATIVLGRADLLALNEQETHYYLGLR